MKRKVIQIAGSTQLVSLPRKWCQRFGINKGDELEVAEEGNKITVSTDKAVDLSSTDFDVNKLGSFLLRSVAAAYKSGYDEVKLNYNNSKELEKLHQFMNNVLPGYEIMDQSEKSCIIKNLSRGMDSEFDNVMRKIFLVTISCGKATFEMINNGTDRYRDVTTLETQNNKFCNLCQRLLNKKGYKDFKKTSFVYCMIWELEKIADEYKYLASYFIDKKYNINEEVVKLLEDVNTMFKEFYELFYKYNEGKVGLISDMKKKIVGDARMLFDSKKMKTDDLKALHHIMNITQQTFNCMGCFLGMRV